MSEVLESPRWQAVGLVIDQNQRDFLASRHSLVEDLVAWFRAIEMFRDTTDERMILRDPTADDLRQHKLWVACLIAEGERLVAECGTRGGLLAGAVKFTLDDVAATLELLYLWQREWHGERMSPEQRREVLKAVFHGEEPAT